MRPLFRSSKRSALSALALALVVAGGAVAVETATGSTPAAADELLPRFDDCDAFVTRMRELALPYVGDRGLNADPRFSESEGRILNERGDSDDLDDFAMPAVEAAADAAAPAADAAAPAADASAGAAPAAPKAANADKAASTKRSSASTPAAGRADPLQKGAQLNSVDSTSSGNPSMSGDDADDAVGTGETGTNIQEAGVDEPDIAKTTAGWSSP